MTVYDNRPTDFFSATKEFHGADPRWFPGALPSSAIQVSAERKVRREAPRFSQWDIVAKALRDWLVTHSSGVAIRFRV